MNLVDSVDNLCSQCRQLLSILFIWFVNLAGQCLCIIYHLHFCDLEI